MAEARATAVGAYVEEDPVATAHVTAAGAYVEEDPNNVARTTAVGAYVEEDPVNAVLVTAVGAYVELYYVEGKQPSKGKPPPKPHPVPPRKHRYRSLFADMIAWYPALASAGSRTLHDFVGNNDGIMQGTVGWLGLDAWGIAADLPGSDANYFNVGDNSVLADADMSIATWVRFDEVPIDPDEKVYIMARSKTGQDSYALGISGNVGGVGARVFWQVGGNYVFNASGPDILPGLAYFIVVSGAGGKAPGTWALYVDGTLEGTSFYSGAVPLQNNDTYIGRLESGGSTGAMNGQIIDIKVFGRSLTPDEVNYLYDPRSRWELNEDRSLLPFGEAPILPGGGGPLALTGISGLSAIT